jgi:hypothetical protein
MGVRRGFRVSIRPTEYFAEHPKSKTRNQQQTSPGGYFHGMVTKAKAGELYLERTVWALRRASEPEYHWAGRGGDRVGRDRGWE